MSKPDLVSPWVPMRNLQDIKAIGKLGEETCELGSAIFRCVIQGVDEAEPVTGKVNREWLHEEVADVEAAAEIVKKHFRLDRGFIEARKKVKMNRLERWLAMVPKD